MSGTFFPDPPRPLGRAFWRRVRGALLWTLCGTAGVALACLVIANRSRDRAESIRVAAAGRTLPCKIVDKSRTYGRSPTYAVKLQVTGDVVRTFSRRVDPGPWQGARVGQSVTYYGDPGRPEQGVAEVERSYRERVGDMIFLAVGAAALAISTAAAVARRVTQMALLRYGVELVSVGTGGDLRLSIGGRSAAVRPPRDGWRRVLVRPPRGPSGYVALASRGLRLRFFPDLRDVPANRLTRDEGIERVLPPPVRPVADSWRAWMAAKRRGLLAALLACFGIAALIAGVAGVAALAASRKGGGGAPFAPASAWAAIPGAAGLILLLQWWRGHWRDRVLWLEGEEVHAVILGVRRLKAGVRYEVGYSYKGHEFRRTVTAPFAWDAWSVPSPPDAPAVTDRLVVLVDPFRPKRWAMVPGRCRR